MKWTGRNMEPDELDPWRGGEDRRAEPRVRYWGTAGIRILPAGTLVLGYLLDLGLGGCLIDLDEAIPAQVGAGVEVLLSLDGFHLRLAGVVGHVEKKRTQAGITFIGLSLRKIEQIHHLMAALIEAEKQRLAGLRPLGG
ncbi:MAG: PilZ domain-containing protein [Terracidiphilus sp.]